MNNFTPRAQQVLALSLKEAQRFGHSYVGTEHLLLGLLRLRHGVAVQILAELGFDLASTRADLKGRVGFNPDGNTASKLPYTASVEKVLILAGKEAKMLGHAVVDAEHILLGLLKDRDCDASRMLGCRGVEIDGIRSWTLDCLRSGSVQSRYGSLTKPVINFRRLPITVVNRLFQFLQVSRRGPSLSNRSLIH